MAIEISRADIISQELLELQSETRFLKLPVDPYLELLGITPLASQVAIINAINNPKYRFVCAAVSRRQGATSFASSQLKHTHNVPQLCLVSDLF